MVTTERQKLERYLQSVGKSVFVEIMYPELRKNMDIDYEYLARKYKQYSEYTDNAQRSRLSTSKTIFRNGWQYDALEIVRGSSNVETRIRTLADKYFNEAIIAMNKKK